jgi:hypothetical protein
VSDVTVNCDESPPVCHKSLRLNRVERLRAMTSGATGVAIYPREATLP